MNADYEGALKARLASLAQSMLDGQTTFIEGAREISSVAFKLGLRSDPDVVPFIAIDSETDALPMGEVRKLWLPEALAKLEPELRQAENWAREVGTHACKALVNRFDASREGA